MNKKLIHNTFASKEAAGDRRTTYYLYTAVIALVLFLAFVVVKAHAATEATPSDQKAEIATICYATYACNGNTKRVIIDAKGEEDLLKQIYEGVEQFGKAKNCTMLKVDCQRDGISVITTVTKYNQK